MSTNYYQIQYKFSFPNGIIKSFSISIDPDTTTSVCQKPKLIPFWTELDFEKCLCCSLKKEDFNYCPIAINIVDLIESFKNMRSSDECVVSCKTPDRTYLKATILQEGLFSIFGIMMATSKCPIMYIFKPMACFHLPFSTIEETVLRSTSYYLLGQYFGYKKGGKLDIELRNLHEHYEKVQAVNEGILRRIKSIGSSKDADKNAVIILNSLAQILPLEIEKKLKSLEYLFTTDI